MEWEPINPREILETQIRQKGGWVNTHTHIDRSYIINSGNWNRTDDSFQAKWGYADEYKSRASVDEIASHMSMVVENQLEQGVRTIGGFIDCDSVVEDKSIRASEIVRDRYRGDIELVFMSQPIKGLVDHRELEWFEYAADYVDIIGGLPEKDARPDPHRDKSEEHFDKIFSIAAEQDKLLHIHVDQLNSPDQTDTERALRKTHEFAYGGKVSLIHCISLAAQHKDYREKIYAGLEEQDISVITCPSAWIDHRRNETLTPTHNAITPIDEMLVRGLNVALGTDNIADIYKPFSDGDMWTELRFLLEATHTYGIEELAKIASTNGLSALGIQKPDPQDLAAC